MMMDIWTVWGAFLVLLTLNFALLAGLVMIDRRRREWRDRFLKLDAMTPTQFSIRWNMREAGRRISDSLLKSGRRLAKAFEERRPIPEGGETVTFRRPVPFETNETHG